MYQLTSIDRPPSHQRSKLQIVSSQQRGMPIPHPASTDPNTARQLKPPSRRARMLCARIGRRGLLGPMSGYPDIALVRDVWEAQGRPSCFRFFRRLLPLPLGTVPNTPVSAIPAPATVPAGGRPPERASHLFSGLSMVPLRGRS
ncbi:hypothetical protein DICSQDRAFT_177261 [Dichomitus squalens LYAD-421 SS1]|uniref:uncharacterized protein n=1 Tax=Dichomitus squalens (strain LYAD-421) TaxID=732165 RepID=UPI00044107D5|nr:uncharacterized protein DICSQDRAFT_177261 [Dichomitus squalens LYAD-421 SS1]EJF65836.1 hypothetical protein DICSQDRAFT_177261 [Dichomitus squalens LYAD-421 SS1]